MEYLSKAQPFSQISKLFGHSGVQETPGRYIFREVSVKTVEIVKVLFEVYKPSVETARGSLDIQEPLGPWKFIDGPCPTESDKEIYYTKAVA